MPVNNVTSPTGVITRPQLEDMSETAPLLVKSAPPSTTSQPSSARKLPDSSADSIGSESGTPPPSDLELALGALFASVLEELRNQQRETREANRTIADGAFDTKIQKNMDAASKMRDAADKSEAAAKKIGSGSFWGGLAMGAIMIASMAIGFALGGPAGLAMGVMVGMALGGAVQGMINGKAQSDAAKLNADASEKEAEKAELDVQAAKEEKIHEQFQDLKKQAVEALQELMELMRQLGQTKQAVRNGWSK